MAIRVDAAEVLEIMGNGVTVTEVDIRPWIEIANNIIDRYSSICTASATTLTLMEKLLTAHFISSTVERGESVTSRAFGDSSETYGMITGEGIRGSTYGQQLLMVDPCGQLQNLFKQRAYSKVL